MKRYILTATPGPGKTSILHELKGQGYSVVEEASEVRKITFEQSLAFEKIHKETYLSLGYDLIRIAPAALAERVYRIMLWTKETLEKP